MFSGSSNTGETLSAKGKMRQEQLDYQMVITFCANLTLFFLCLVVLHIMSFDQRILLFRGV